MRDQSLKRDAAFLVAVVFLALLAIAFFRMTDETPSQQPAPTESVSAVAKTPTTSPAPVGPKAATIINKVAADKKAQLAGGKQ